MWLLVVGIRVVCPCRVLPGVTSRSLGRVRPLLASILLFLLVVVCLLGLSLNSFFLRLLVGASLGMLAHLLLLSVSCDDVCAIGNLLRLTLRALSLNEERRLFEIAKSPVSFRFGATLHRVSIHFHDRNVVLLLNFGLLLGVDCLDLFFHGAGLGVAHLLVALLVESVELSRTCVFSSAVHLLTHDLGKSTAATVVERALWLLLLIVSSCLLHGLDGWCFEGAGW